VKFKEINQSARAQNETIDSMNRFRERASFQVQSENDMHRLSVLVNNEECKVFRAFAVRQINKNAGL
jgi:hypothetical protein